MAVVEGVIVRVGDVRFVVKDFSDIIQRRLSTGRFWEPELLRYVQSSGDSPRSHLVNVGAHIGSMCVPASACYGKVTAFEPVKDSFEHLSLHAKLNGCANLEAFNVALSNQAGECPIVFNQKNTGGTHVVTQEDIDLGRRHAQDRLESVTVACSKLDDFELEPPPSVVLVDIEGHDMEFLEGAKRTLAAFRPKLIMEIWTDDKRRFENMSTSQSDVIQAVAALGYGKVYRAGLDTFIFEA